MEFRILGPLEVAGPDGPVELGSTKLRSVLALLLIHAGEVVSAERLIDDLWEGTPPRSATATLQTYISQLRKQLGPAVVQSASGGYRISLDDHTLDAVQFETALDARAQTTADPASDTERLRSALDAWRGAALADFAGAHWATAEAARLEGLRQIAAEDLVESRLALGEHARVVPELETAVAANPLQERPWAQLMVALYRCGRQADALRAYARLRTHLGEELGIEPSPELAQLEQAILLQDPELDWHPPARESATPVTEPLGGLPTGVVTFLLTDVVGSSQLWDEQPAAMAKALVVHDAFVADAVHAHKGRVVKQRGEGDSTFAVFTRASDAVQAALQLQLGLSEHSWPGGAELSVRMAIHTGEAIERDGDYYGTTVNRAARLRALAQGGQVLVSQATVELLIDHLPPGVTILELGTRSLRGLRRLEHVYAIVTGDSPQPSRDLSADDAIPPMPKPLERPTAEPFVGRADELAVLEKAWQGARAGARRAILLSGEPGIGKTRLAAELAQQVAADGGVVLYGRCDDELGVAFQPFTEALRQYVTTCSPATLRAHAGPGLSELSRLVSELESIFPGLPPPRRSDPETERYELLESVVSLLANASRAAPMMLVLDDLHWATKPTLLLLRHLLHAKAPMSLLVLGTYRSTEASRRSVIGELLPALRSSAGLESIALHGFSLREVGNYLRSTTGPGNDADALANSLLRDTNGNPLFVREIARELAEHGGSDSNVNKEQSFESVPQSVRDVIERRLARLSPSTRQTLASAAVIGARVQIDLLEQLNNADIHEGALLDAIDDAIDAGILIESVDEDTLEFTHALIRRAIYTDLTASRRSRLHQHVAQTLESFGDITNDDERLPALAFHWARAARMGHGDKASDYALLAGRQALARLAVEDAIMHIEGGLRVVEQRETARATEADLLIALGDARMACGAVSESRDAYLRAANLIKDGSPELIQIALSWHGPARVAVADPRGEPLLRRALRGVSHDRDPATAARLHAHLALADHDSVVGRDQREYVWIPTQLLEAELAVHLAEQSGDAHARFDAYCSRFWTIKPTDTPWTHAASALDAAREIDSPAVILEALVYGLIGEGQRGNYARFRELAHEHWHLAETSGLTIPLGFSRGIAARLCMAAGDLDGAERLSTEAIEITNDQAVMLFWVAVHLRCLSLRDRNAEAIADIRTWVDADAIPAAARTLIDAALALYHAESGEIAEAAAMLSELCHENFARVAPLGDVFRAGELAMLADACAVVGDRQMAGAIREALLPWEHQNVQLSLAEDCGPTSLFLGKLERVLGWSEQAIPHLEHALECTSRGENDWKACEARIELAAALRHEGNHGRAAPLIAAARDFASTNGIRLLLRRLELH